MSTPNQRGYTFAILGVLALCAGLMAMKKLNDLHFNVTPEALCEVDENDNIVNCQKKEFVK